MAALTLADLMNPLVKLEKSFEAQNKKIDDLIQAVAVGKSGAKLKTLDKEILKELKTQTGLLEAIAAGSVSSAKAKVDKTDSKTKSERLAAGGAALSTLGIGVKDLSSGLLLLSLVPERTLGKLDKFITGIADVFERLDLDKFKKGVDSLGLLGTAVWDFSKSLALSALLIIPVTLALPLIAFNLMAVGWAVGKIGEMRGVNEGAKSLNAIGTGLIGFSGGIAALAIASLVIAAKPVVLPIMVGALTLVGGALYLIGKGAKEIRSGSRALKDAGIGLAAFAGGVGVFALVSSLISWQEIPKMGSLLLVVGGALGVVGLASKFIRDGAVAITIASVGLVALSAGLLVFNYATQQIGQEGYLLMAGVLVGVSAIIGIAGAALPLMAQGAIALGIAGGALALLGAGLLVFNYSVKQIGGVEEVGMMIAAIGGVATAFAGAGLLSLLIAPGAIALTLAGAALFLVSAGLSTFSLVWGMQNTRKLFEDSGERGIFGGKQSNLEYAITSIAHGMAVNPVTAGFILLGSAALTVASIALMSMTAGIGLFGRMYAREQDKGSKSLFAMREGYQVSGLFGKSRGGSNLEFSIEAIASSFTLSPVKIASIYASSPALIAAGLSLATIAGGINQFIKTIDRAAGAGGIDSITEKITKTISTVSQAFGAIGGQRGSTGLSGGLKRLFGVGGDIPGVPGMYSPDQVKRGIESVSGMGKILVNVAKGVAAFATMQYKDETGKVFLIGPSEQAKAVDNITALMTTVPQAFGAIGGNVVSGLGGFAAKLGLADIPGAEGRYSPDQVRRGIESVAGIGGVLSGLAAGVAAFASGTYTDSEGKEHKIDYASFAEGGTAFEAIRGLLTSIPTVFGSIGKSSSVKDKLGRLISGGDGTSAQEVKRGIDAVSGMGEILSGIANFVTAFTKTQGTVKTTEISKFLTDIVTTVTQLAKDSAGEDRDGVDLITGLFSALAKAEDAAAPLEKVAKSVDKIKNSINAIKLDSLKQTVELMQNVNSLKENQGPANIERVVEAIAGLTEKLSTVQQQVIPQPAAPATAQPQQDLGIAIKELRGTLGQINSTLSGLPANIAAIEIRLPRE